MIAEVASAIAAMTITATRTINQVRRSRPVVASRSGQRQLNSARLAPVEFCPV
jgi:hypothetical protein